MNKKHNTQVLQIVPIGEFFIKLVIGDNEHVMPADDLYLNLLSAIVGKKAESLQILSSTTTTNPPILSKK